MSMTPEERKAKKAELNRRYHEANKEAVAEQKHQYREANKEAVTEQYRRWREANKEKVAERNRRWRESNKEKEAERKRQYREANKESVAERKRQKQRRCQFTREDGSSFEAWVSSVRKPALVFEAIAKLTPNEGQTLAELIHELSGYAMDVCEQIANPTVIEDSPALTPPAAPDLF